MDAMQRPDGLESHYWVQAPQEMLHARVPGPANQERRREEQFVRPPGMPAMLPPLPLATGAQQSPKQPPEMQPPPLPRGTVAALEPRPRTPPPWQVRPKPPHPSPESMFSTAQCHLPSSEAATPQPPGAIQGRAWPPQVDHPPVRDTNTQVIALSAAARAIADAVAFLATFGISGEALVSLHSMLETGLYSASEARENATAQLTHDDQPQQQHPPDLSGRATGATLVQQPYPVDTPVPPTEGGNVAASTRRDPGQELATTG